MDDKVPAIMESVFECTLEMINKDFHEYPEHRVEFFKLLQAINLYCFQALLKLDTSQFKFVIDSCMWASKHDNREVESTGLTMCLELMNNMAETDAHISSVFFGRFFVPILQDVFFVLTDTDHKAGMFILVALFIGLLVTNTVFQDSNTKRFFLIGCSTLSRQGRSRSLFIRQNKLQRGHLTKISFKNMSPTFSRAPSKTYKSE